MMKRVLIISYTFPPVGGAGVQRIAKFVKYLPSHGWQTSVLTASNASVPLFDHSLCNEIPSDTLIERVPTWEPSYALKSKVAAAGNGHAAHNIQRAVKSLVRSSANLLLQPDPQILWAPNAIRRGRQMLREKRHDAILATGPPFSSFLIGAHLSHRMGLPLVLDYRDEWDITNSYGENRSNTILSSTLQQQLQKWALRQSKAVVATTEASIKRIAQINPVAPGLRSFVCIHNGFDPQDFNTEPNGTISSSRYRLIYIGTLWRLTSINPLIVALERLFEQSPELAHRFELVVVGRRMAEQDALLDRLKNSPCIVTKLDYVSHDEAIRLMYGANRLCLLLTDTRDSNRVVPAKVFEYIASRRPILAIAPRGEMWNLLDGYPDARRHQPSDIDGIVHSINDDLTIRSKSVSSAEAFKTFDYRRFSRLEQARQLADVLNSVVVGPVIKAKASQKFGGRRSS